MTSPRGHETGVAAPSQCRSSSGHGGHLHGGRRDGGRWPGLHQPLDHARTLSRHNVRQEEKLAQSKIFFVVLMWISIRVGDQLNIRTPGSLARWSRLAARASAHWITDYSVTLISYFPKICVISKNILTPTVISHSAIEALNWWCVKKWFLWHSESTKDWIGWMDK